jgi:hypothetical protein
MRLQLAALAVLAVTGSAMADDRFACMLRAEPGPPESDIAAKLALSDMEGGTSREFDLNLIVLKNGDSQNAYYTLVSREDLPGELEDATFAVVTPRAVTAALLLADDDVEMSFYMEAGKSVADFDFGNPIVTLGEGADEGEATFEINDDVTVSIACVRNF